MPIDVAEYQQLKSKVDKVRADADRAAGALERSLSQLKKDFDCGSLEAAEKLLKKLEREERVADQEYADAMAEFQTEWDVYLGG